MATAPARLAGALVCAAIKGAELGCPYIRAAEMSANIKIKKSRNAWQKMRRIVESIKRKTRAMLAGGPGLASVC